MHCPTCQRENLPDSLFCTECGAKTELACSSCGGTNPPVERGMLLAQQLGDQEQQRAHLEEARRLYEKICARGHAQRLARELGAGD